MRTISLNTGWRFGPGLVNFGAMIAGKTDDRPVTLPHDYMIASDIYPEAPSGAASGYYNAGVAHYTRDLEIPADWAGDRIALRFDGAMMNATVEVNGDKVCLQHYGYAPFEADITRFVYPGEKNLVVITVNPSMQPNSRWYSGAGLFRSVALTHTPKLAIAFGGLAGSTSKIEYAPSGEPETAFLKVSADIRNDFAENRVAEVAFDLLREGTEEVVKSAKTRVQVPALSTATAYMTLTVDHPLLWSAEAPNLYSLRARVKEVGTYRTHIIPAESPAEDAESVLFGIRTVEADVRHGLQINGQEVKLRGGCLHHDNGVIGSISVYDAEARKVALLKSVGFNAVRTTHNPPSAALIEACDRLGMYVFDEAFDAWGMGKQPGDYNQFFETDWQKDLSAFVRRDRCHPSVILWSTGNEITERAGLGQGYVWATRLAETIRALDPSRPVSNAICSFWNGLDTALMTSMLRKWAEQKQTGGLQNADLGGKKDLLWEEYTEAFANGLDVVGYNYLEGKYDQDHEMFPERVILGSENYPKEIGIHWPKIEKTPWIIGDFTWTAWDYIGEAGIGKSVILAPDDPRKPEDIMPWSFGSPYPWRTANDADFDVTGGLRPQGAYRSIVWHSGRTAVFSYDPDAANRAEILTPWGFPGVEACWNWPGKEGKPVDVAVFSAAEEVELFVNGASVGRQKAGEALVLDLPLTFRFRTVYTPGTVEAVSYIGGQEVSRGTLATAGAPAALRLTLENAPSCPTRPADASLTYVRVAVVDAEGRVVPDAALPLTAKVQGPAELLGFGSGNPVTDENYTRGQFTSWHGQALAVLRAAEGSGPVILSVSTPTLPPVELTC